MKSIEEVRDYLLENCVDEYGNLDLSGLDFSDFEGSVFTCDMKVKHSLYQNRQTVGRNLYQDRQQVRRNLFQDYQTVGRNLFQNSQTVGGDLFSHKLEDNEKWKDCETSVIRIKELKPITMKELEEMGYELI